MEFAIDPATRRQLEEARELGEKEFRPAGLEADRNGAPIPVGHPFYTVKNAVYWSSTTSTVFSDIAWVVSLGVGSSNFISKSAGGTVWAVRR